MLPVPDVVGQSQVIAVETLIGAGFTVGAVEEQFDLSPAGEVLSQSPRAGVVTLETTPIALTISKGPLMRPVPNVVGQAQSMAVETLTTANFIAGAVNTQYNLTVPVGEVITQSPRAGVVTFEGTAVDLVVSLGGIPVPDVSARSRTEARPLIVAAQLSVGSETGEYHPTIPVDVVIRQNPPAETPVLPGTPIDLFYSLGPQPVLVPDVVGQTLDAAVSILSGAELGLGAVTEQFSATVAAGRVISQTPVGGASVLPGSMVELVISRGVHPVVVPDVVGLLQAQAESAIIAASLLVGNVAQIHDNTTPEGYVVSQDPLPGTEMPPGSAVAITVSLGSLPEGEGEGEGEGEIEGEGEGVPPIDVTTAQQLLAEVFAEADANGDGMLSFGEAVAAMPGLTRDVFDELDTNGDGQLSPEELDMDTGCGCMGCLHAKSRSFGDGLTILFGLLGMVALAHLKRW